MLGIGNWRPQPQRTRGQNKSNILKKIRLGKKTFGVLSPDSEAMGFLLQITMSWLRALSRQVAGAGAGAVSWLCTWWRQGAGGAGRWVPVLGARRRCWCRVRVIVLEEESRAGCRTRK